MVNELLAGIIVGTCWLFGIILYKLAHEEIDVWAKKRTFPFRWGILFVVIFAIVAAFNHIEGGIPTSTEVDFIALFAAGLFASAWYGINKKPNIKYYSS